MKLKLTACVCISKSLLDIANVLYRFNIPLISSIIPE